MDIVIYCKVTVDLRQTTIRPNLLLYELEIFNISFNLQCKAIRHAILHENTGISLVDASQVQILISKSYFCCIEFVNISFEFLGEIFEVFIEF